MSEDMDEAGDADFDPVAALAGPLMKKVLGEVAAERSRADAQEGFFRDYSDGTAGRSINGPTISRDKQNAREADLRAKQAGNKLTWRHQLEAASAGLVAEDSDGLLRARLVHLAGLCVAWVEAIDRRKDERRIERKRRQSWHVRLGNWLRGRFLRKF